MMCIRLLHTLLIASSMEKELKSKFSKTFAEPKTPKGGYIMGVKEAMKEEDMVFTLQYLKIGPMCFSSRLGNG